MGGFRKQGTATPIVHHCGQNEASRAEPRVGKHSRYLVNRGAQRRRTSQPNATLRLTPSSVLSTQRNTHIPLLSLLDDARTRSALVVRRCLPHKQGQRNAFRVFGSFGFSGSVGRTAYCESTVRVVLMLMRKHIAQSK